MFSISFYYLDKYKALYIMKLRGAVRIPPLYIPYRGSEALTTRGCRASFRKFSGLQNAFSFKSSDFLIFNFAIVVSQVVCLQRENK